MKKDALILIEFNELCPSLLTRWMNEGQLPNFKTFHDASQVFVTEADVKESVNLEPWIQWYSLHTGLSYYQHGVFHLSDGPKHNHKDIWQVLLDHKKKVGNFSSMNAKSCGDLGGVFLPDPWCTTEKASPHELKEFHAFISKTIQEYTNDNQMNRFAETANFVRFLLAHGLKLSTCLTIVGQLISERVSGGASQWMRASVLDEILFDVFSHYFYKEKLEFATFFSNSTAHYQHCYWRHMEPDVFRLRPSDEEMSWHKNSILYGYQAMDKLMGKFLEMEKDGVTLILTTALSQQAYLKKEDIGGQHFYRPHNMEELLTDLGLECVDVLPVMTHQFVVRFKDAQSTEKALRALSSIKYKGEDVFWFESAEENSLCFGNQIMCEVPDDARVEILADSPKGCVGHLQID